MYSLSQVLHGIRNPEMLLWEINRMYYSFVNESAFNDSGVDIFREDWDTLIILDACRADVFEQRVSLPGATGRRHSRASMTREWVEANFAGRHLTDTVYITAVNQLQTLPEEHRPTLHDFIWLGTDEDTEEFGSMRTVLPEKMTQSAIKVHETYPDKRIVVHFGQPHQPYLGPTGQKFHWTGDFHQNVTQSQVTDEEVRQAYNETLDIVLSEVDRLLSQIEGKIVVSADHGEMLGEQMYPVPIRHYGHPRGIYVDELITVPWHVYESGPRRRITDGKPQAIDDVEREQLESHLREMGYV